jgi:hypothetical protein
MTFNLAAPQGTSPASADRRGERRLVISEVPEEWRKHAREPWRILFPDLEWTPPSRDE